MKTSTQQYKESTRDLCSFDNKTFTHDNYVLVNDLIYPFPPILPQLDGCATLPDSTNHSSIQLSPQQQSPMLDISLSPNLLPHLQSTPIIAGHEIGHDLGDPHPPGLLDSLVLNSSQSLSLENLPNLENFLPFTLSPSHQALSPPTMSQQSSSIISNPNPDLSPHPIPVIVGNRNPHPAYQQPMHRPQLRTIRRDNKAITALSLPRIMLANHRSIFPKFNHLVDEVLEMNMQLGLHSEVWEDSESSLHANKIEEALELHGIQYISTPRVIRKGGGAAITLIKDSPLSSLLAK